jgi:hypothetical protein
VGRWPRPKDHTVPRIIEAGLDTWVFKPLQDGIEVKSFEVPGKEVCFLLRIACSAVGGVAGLDLFLEILAETAGLNLERAEAAKSFIFPETVEYLGHVVRMESFQSYRIIFTSFNQRIVRVRECCGVDAG